MNDKRCLYRLYVSPHLGNCSGLRSCLPGRVKDQIYISYHESHSHSKEEGSASEPQGGAQLHGCREFTPETHTGPPPTKVSGQKFVLSCTTECVVAGLPRSPETNAGWEPQFSDMSPPPKQVLQWLGNFPTNKMLFG